MSFATRAMSSPREQNENVKFSNGDSADYNNNIEFSSSSFNFPAVGNTNDLNMSSRAARTDYNAHINDIEKLPPNGGGAPRLVGIPSCAGGGRSGGRG